MEQDDVRAHDENPEAVWMRRLGTMPVEAPEVVDPQVLWWKAQALRRLDAERPYETADYIQVGAAFVAAIVLLGILLGSTPQTWDSPSLAVPTASSMVLLTVGVILAGLNLRRSR
jgi:hypothetical protein